MARSSFAIVLTPIEFDEAVSWVKALGEFCVLPEYCDVVPFPQYGHPNDIPAGQRNLDATESRDQSCFLWNRAISVPPQCLKMHPPNRGYRLDDSGSDVIAMTLRYKEEIGVLTSYFKIDDMVQMPDDSWVMRSAESIGWFDSLKRYCKARSKYLPGERVYVTEGAFEQATAVAKYPYWYAEASEKFARARRPKPVGSKKRTLSYSASLETLNDVASVVGVAKPRARRRPRYDDEPPGPSIFRASLEDVELRNLKLPGLYIGKSELRRVDWAGSNLHLSTFNWNDFVDCDFSECNLSDSDLRCCNFIRCRFVGTDLSKSNLSGSGFEDCEFTNAMLCEAILSEDQRTMRFSVEQQKSARWSVHFDEPEGC